MIGVMTRAWDSTLRPTKPSSARVADATTARICCDRTHRELTALLGSDHRILFGVPRALTQRRPWASGSP
ncbi:hypothetical protein AB0I82_03925 [Streptomyces sp. NPDC050315]|uniref:hypothetical protein n=1 Tax=Streptomyces sp. NPDC050315 TaxID=3155039 RepID=UPI00341D144D